MMSNSQEPENYWDERFRRHGHTGWGDELIYAYDQPLRLKAINKALVRAKVSVSNAIRVFDVGCGTGDLVFEFAKRGAEVIGIDVSQEVIEYAQRRLIDYPNVKLYTQQVGEANFASDSFDLITSVTVLQHVTPEEAFERAITNTVRMAKPGAKILILETSPIKRGVTGQSTPYFRIRTRREWIHAFQGKECVLTYELGLPQLGVRLLGIYNKVSRLLLAPILRKSAKLKSYLDNDDTPRLAGQRGGLETLYNLPRRIILKMTWYLDCLLIPFPRSLTNLRILIFTKQAI